jgi:hypothetical protein
LQDFENGKHIVILFTDNDSIMLNDLEENQNHQKEVHDQNIKLTPKNYVNFESIFTRDDQTNILDPREEPSVKKIQETQKINIGNFDFPKYINLGTSYTTENIDQYIKLFKKFQDIFSWSYDDLKEYDKFIFQHIILLKDGSKPFNQKLRIINPKINPLVKIELEKLKKAGIIFSIRH